MKATPRQLKQFAQRNLWGSINIYKPDGKTPAELIAKVRLRCLLNGGDPGHVTDVKMAMIEIGWEDPALQKGVFHPDYLARVASSWAFNWRASTDKFKNKLLAEFENLKNKRR